MESYINFLPDDIIYSIIYYIDNLNDLNNFIFDLNVTRDDDFWRDIFYQHIPKARIFLTNEDYKTNYFKLRYVKFYDVAIAKEYPKSKLKYPYGFHKISHLSSRITLYNDGSLRIPTKHMKRLTNDQTDKQSVVENLNIIDFDTARENMAFIMHNRDLYTMGKNNRGQLGHGDLLQRNIPTGISRKFGKIIKVSLSDRNMAFVNSNGEVFTCGDGRYGKLGHGDENDQLIPRKIEYFSQLKIVDVKYGFSFIILLDSNGICYYFGESIENNISISNIIDPKIFRFSKKIVSIDCHYGFYILFLDELGRVYSYGYQTHGELGLGIGIQGTGRISEPRLIPFDDKVKYISAGYFNSAFITDSNELYVSGKYIENNIDKQVNIPTKIDIPMKNLESVTNLTGVIIVKGYDF